MSGHVRVKEKKDSARLRGEPAGPLWGVEHPTKLDKDGNMSRCKGKRRSLRSETGALHN